MSPQEIDKKLKEIMNEKKGSIQENDEENLDIKINLENIIFILFFWSLIYHR